MRTLTSDKTARHSLDEPGSQRRFGAAAPPPPGQSRCIRYAPLLALAAGVLNVFSFAPFELWPLQIATLSFVLWLVQRQAGPSAAARSARLGLAYGFGWSVAGVHWLYISMHDYGGLPGWMAALAVALLGAVLGAFAAGAMAGGAWMQRRWSLAPAAALLLVFPAAWALSEWLRGWILTGFPWVTSGYAHTVGPLAGFAPIVGVYGLAWVSALVSGAIVLLPNWRAALAIVVVLLAGLGLKNVAWTTPEGKPISVRLLQGNVPQEMKFEPQRIRDTLALYYQMIEAAPADLIATPETAIPLLSSQLPPDYLPLLRDYASTSGSHVILGLPVSDGPGRYANSVLGFAPGAAQQSYRYDKHHLVPFGEFIPPGARWFVDLMNIPLGDFTRGAVLQQPFAVGEQRVMPNICYEDLFGEEIAAQLAASYHAGTPQATILLNVSNIAWFGDSIALPQHLQISQMRSLETGRPMLRATNTGTTAVIDPKGRVLAKLAPYDRAILTASVQGYQGATPYVLAGNRLAVGLACLALLAAWLLGRRKSQMAVKNR